MKKIIITILALIGLYNMALSFSPVPINNDKMNELILIQENI